MISPKLHLSAAFCRNYITDWLTIIINSTTLDTQTNRDAMPDSDKTSWLPPLKVAELIRAWADGENRPENGSFAKLTYKSGVVIPEFL